MASAPLAGPQAAARDALDVRTQQVNLEDEDERACWICLGGDESGDLIQPCQCPRFTHSACLARWQLVSAGKNEETRCRFCNRELPDWRPALTPETLQPKPSVMSVRYRGVTHRIQYNPGPDGLESFLATLQSIGIKVATASQVTFLCRSPDTGEEMALRGLKAFDAAAYCASITAAKRMARNSGRRRGGGGGAAAAADRHGDMGVHTAGPCPPSTAVEQRRCEDRGAAQPGAPAAAAVAAPAQQEQPENGAAPQRRVVAHIHAEAFQELDDAFFEASATAASGAPFAQPSSAPAHAVTTLLSSTPEPGAAALPPAGRRRRSRSSPGSAGGGAGGARERPLLNAVSSIASALGLRHRS